MQDETQRIARPKLTLPAEAAALLKEEYAKADVILEYGSGGSTVVAGEMPGKTVFSVESDANWAKMMEGWFEENPPAANVCIHHVNIGPTKEWGAPINHQNFRCYPEYPLSIWATQDFLQPSVILIDGRFRVGCFLAAVLGVKKQTTLIFDDYLDRPFYHVVEKLFTPVSFANRMAKFIVEPIAVDGDFFRDWVSNMIDPR